MPPYAPETPEAVYRMAPQPLVPGYKPEVLDPVSESDQEDHDQGEQVLCLAE